MKLTTQAQVVQHMKDGWKLGYSHFGNCYWLQKPDLCEGGEHIDVRGNVIRAMLKNGKVRKDKDDNELWLTRFEFGEQYDKDTEDDKGKGEAVRPEPGDTQDEKGIL